jgi:hypothetical protein
MNGRLPRMRALAVVGLALVAAAVWLLPANPRAPRTTREPASRPRSAVRPAEAPPPRRTDAEPRPTPTPPRLARPEVEALPVPAEAFVDGVDVTAEVALEPHEGFVTHRFTGRLAGFQTLDLDVAPGAVWVGTSRGLLRHDLASGSWRLWDARAGLAGERVNEIAVVGRRVLADTYRPTNPGSITGTGLLTFDTASRAWLPVEIPSGAWDLWGDRDGRSVWLGLDRGAEWRDLVSGHSRRFTRRAGQLLHDSVHAVRRHGSLVAFAMMGEWVEARKDFEGGGVTLWDRERDRFRSYGAGDGLARGYSCDVFVDDDEVWVAHWDEERGLSRLDRRGGRWEKVTKSANGVDVGGVVLAGEPGRLWIGQQGALVRLDRHTRTADVLREADGLPGYIVSAIVVADDAVWSSVYAYGSPEVRAAGVVRFAREAR